MINDPNPTKAKVAFTARTLKRVRHAAEAVLALQLAQNALDKAENAFYSANMPAQLAKVRRLKAELGSMTLSIGEDLAGFIDSQADAIAEAFTDNIVPSPADE